VYYYNAVIRATLLEQILMALGSVENLD